MTEKRAFSRRVMIKQSALLAGAAVLPPALPRYTLSSDKSSGASTMSSSPFGFWRIQESLPEFVYTANQQTLAEALWDPIDRPQSRRHFHMMGNRAIQMQVSNTGDIALYDESEGMRWLVYGDDEQGTGHSVITEQDGANWGSQFSRRPAGDVPERVLGPTYFGVNVSHRGLHLQRTVLCPEGDLPWVLIRVDLSLDKTALPRTINHQEQWQLRPRFLHSWQSSDSREEAAAGVKYGIKKSANAMIATENFGEAELSIGNPATLMLHALGDDASMLAGSAGMAHPMLSASSTIALQPGDKVTLWFRFGRFDERVIADPAWLFDDSLNKLRKRLPAAKTPISGSAKLEIPWHAAVLTGGANRDKILGGHTLNQGSVYAYQLGANAAARDSLQHALPLVYSEPDLALSVLRNTCSWGSPDGDLPYALTGNKQPMTDLFRPSDQNLWVFWLAVEYAVITENYAEFDRPVAYHPVYKTGPVTLKQHLMRQFRFFIDSVGRGERNHVRILNADWNDMVLEDSGINHQLMIEKGGSVLNSAMASWVLSVLAPLMDKLGEPALAEEARQQADDLRQLVAASWNGRWFQRAYEPGGAVIGDDRCWLEVQPWAILCGAASKAQAIQVLDYIKAHNSANSPLGARVIWPPDYTNPRAGQGTTGGIWYSINMTLVWAAAKMNHPLAPEEWNKMTLANHVSSYPNMWEGTLSGPDAWNAPESDRPGRTWTTSLFSMQSFPVNNLHAHSQPLLAYLRLLGIEPSMQGGLSKTRRPDIGSFNSNTFSSF
ncbi:MAG: hypothetical protein GWP63_12635 [Haliea sp.]|nr:hypothetical protein [Haliea sp.]